jgi:Ca2+/Na+ antiporter
MRIMQQIDQKKDTADAHWNTDCLWKNTLIVFCFCFFLHNKISLPKTMYKVVLILLIYLYLSFTFELGIMIQIESREREVRCFFILLHEEVGFDYM